MNKIASFSEADSEIRVPESVTLRTLIVRIRDLTPTLQNTLETAIACAWPTVPNTFSMGPPTILWLSPTAWLVAGGAENIGETIEAACTGHIRLISDMTDGLTAFDVSGGGARHLLSKGCSLDLHPRAFDSNRCARTLVAQMPAIIHRGSDSDGFRLYVDSSLAEHFRKWVSDAVTTDPADPA